MVLATVFVLALTASAPALGAQLTGLLAPFPLYASILAVFAHQQQGPVAAAGVLRGLLLGLFSFAGFCVVLATLLVPAGVATAFGAAIALALGIQGVSLWGLRRGERSQERELRR
jgi:O-antigen/teichoic acid export membrane protein